MCEWQGVRLRSVGGSWCENNRKTSKKGVSVPWALGAIGTGLCHYCTGREPHAINSGVSLGLSPVTYTPLASPGRTPVLLPPGQRHLPGPCWPPGLWAVRDGLPPAGRYIGRCSEGRRYGGGGAETLAAAGGMVPGGWCKVRSVKGGWFGWGPGCVGSEGCAVQGGRYRVCELPPAIGYIGRYRVGSSGVGSTG